MFLEDNTALPPPSIGIVGPAEPSGAAGGDAAAVDRPSLERAITVTWPTHSDVAHAQQAAAAAASVAWVDSSESSQSTDTDEDHWWDIDQPGFSLPPAVVLATPAAAGAAVGTSSKRKRPPPPRQPHQVATMSWEQARTLLNSPDSQVAGRAPRLVRQC